MPIQAFANSLARATPADTIAFLRNGLIGEGATINTPHGLKKLVYADYTASGRALEQVESFVRNKVLPFYANSHTEASYCGAHTTRLREAARAFIARQVRAGDDCAVIFAGAGATAAINRAVALSGIRDMCGGARRPVVLIGPYEHHSNILPWRESGAEVIEIGEAPGGGPDMNELEDALKAHADAPLVIGSFSAASNVTGILTDTEAVTRMLKAYGALAFWDYAGGGPYLDIDMAPEQGAEKDAVFISPHKFPGGPGASGILVIRKTAVRASRPTWPGGGSVAYVSPWAHDYLPSVEEREEAGTPNILGDIRAGLVFAVKAAVGVEAIDRRDRELLARALHAWRANADLVLLAQENHNRLPIISFLLRDPAGGFVHHEAVTRMLSDRAGIQVRGGCVCAGPYGHRLLGVDRAQSEAIRAEIKAGKGAMKPGWVRLNFGYLMSDATADYIISEVNELSRRAAELAAEEGDVVHEIAINPAIV